MVLSLSLSSLAHIGTRLTYCSPYYCADTLPQIRPERSKLTSIMLIRKKALECHMKQFHGVCVDQFGVTDQERERLCVCGGVGGH